MLSRKFIIVFLAALFSGACLFAAWETLDISVSKPDYSAYETSIPKEAFTEQGISLDINGAQEYTLTLKSWVTNEAAFDVEFEIPPESMKTGDISIDVIFANDKAGKKLTGTFKQNFNPKNNYVDSKFLKDGKTETMSGGYARTGGPGISFLRLQKSEAFAWYLQRTPRDGFWGQSQRIPGYRTDCDEFKASFTVRGTKDARGKVLIKSVKLSGAVVKARDASARTYLFSFGPVTKENPDGFTPVSEYSNYSKEKGYGWKYSPVNTVYQGSDIPLNDAQISDFSFQPMPKDRDIPGWRSNDVRRSYWYQQYDKDLFTSYWMGNDYVAFFDKYIDLKTSLERGYVTRARTYHYFMNDLYQKDVEERRGAMYLDDDLSAEFIVDVPNGTYNMIAGVGYANYAGRTAFSIEVQGKVREKNVKPGETKVDRHEIRNVVVTDGKLDLRLFADLREASGIYRDCDIGSAWTLNYLIVLPAEDKNKMLEWEWKIISEKSKKIRKVTFIDGEPPVLKNEGNFVSLNGKPYFQLKTQYNYHPYISDQFTYYCLTNCLLVIPNMQNSSHFFNPDWERLSLEEDYPWSVIDTMNMMYSWGYLTTLYMGNAFSFVPRKVAGEGTPSVDSRGRANRYFIKPPLNSALDKEIQKETYTMLFNQLYLHPAMAYYYIFEELWHPEDCGYDDQSLVQFQEYLRIRYKTIEKLNAEWHRTYASFEDIVAPTQENTTTASRDFWQYTPEYTNFRKFRSWAQGEMLKFDGNLIHKMDQNHVTEGAKGDFGSQSWQPGESLDQFGWYTPRVSASVSRYFKKSAMTGGYLLPCEDAYLDGRKQADHKPGPKQYLGKDEVKIVYNKLISGVFCGMKAFWNEWYDDGIQHVFHQTDYIKDQGPKFNVKHWTGQICFFEKTAFEGPPVRLERGAIYASAANKTLYRIAHLFLPAKPPEPKVLVPTVEESFFLRGFGVNNNNFEIAAMRVLRSTGLNADFLRMSEVKDLSVYKLIVLGDTAEHLSKPDVLRIIDFVNNGGKLMIMNAAGFSYVNEPRRYSAKPGEVFPVKELSELAGYRIICQNSYQMDFPKPVKFTLPGASKLQDGKIGFYYEPAAGNEVFLKGDLGGREIALGFINKKRNVIVSYFPMTDSPDEALVRGLSRYFKKIIDGWNIDKSVTVSGLDDNYDMYCGSLSGDGYTLAAACNLEQDFSRKISLKVGNLADGDYAVIDVTGEAPDLMVKADKGPAQAKNPEALRSKISFKLTAKEIASSGIPCEVKPAQAKIFLLRPLKDMCWVSMWEPAIKGFVKHPVGIVYGNSTEQLLAGEIRSELQKYGVKVSTYSAQEIKTPKAVHEVKIQTFGIPIKKPRIDKSDWYLVDTFNNEPCDSDRSLIFVGSEDTNPAIRHLGAQDTFVYDKVLEKVSAAYPGERRGVVCMVDAVNSAFYDVRSSARDGIIVGGSDAAGTKTAVNTFLSIIRRNLK